jgi:hypothetical protein
MQVWRFHYTTGEPSGAVECALLPGAFTEPGQEGGLLWC